MASKSTTRSRTTLLVVAAVVIGCALRFAARSPLWLDEALSVNIARDDRALAELLRRDGHPPLYYWLLGLWSDVVGTGDRQLRALSGVLSVATLPFAYLVSRRLHDEFTARIVLAVVAVSPFAIRYANETRMYALVTLLCFAGWWAVERARHRPTIERLAVVSAIGAALLYSHYWSIWLLGATGLLLLVASTGRFESWNKTAARRLAGALVVSGSAFLPWAGVLVDQAQSTGTPWADPDRPTSDLVGLLFDLAGGKRSEAQLLAMFFVVLAAVAMFTRVQRSAPNEPAQLFAGRLHRDAGAPLAVAGLTLAIGLGVGFATGSVFVPRYAATILPLLLVVIALGIRQLAEYRPSLGQGVLAVVVLAGIFTSGVELVDIRSQGQEIAEYINANGTSEDLIVFCPDQLGPATNRYLDPRFVDQRVYPTQGSPALVDWRDYTTRNRSSVPQEVADSMHDGLGAERIWLVTATNYRTFEGKCQGLIDALAQREGQPVTVDLVVTGNPNVFEPASLYRFGPPS